VICTDCNSRRVLELTAKCSDCCGYSIGNLSGDGYVPQGLGIGGGDYVEFNICLDCGQVQGQFPRPKSDLEQDASDEDIEEFYNNYFEEGERIGFSQNRGNVRSHLYDVKQSAKDICQRFGTWIEEFLNENNGSPYDKETGVNAPSIEKFIQMYRNNNTDIDG